MPHFTSHSEENYLKTLYKLGSQEVKKVNNIALAKSLSLNPATVLEMVRKLAKKGLAEVLPDKTIHLTDKGRKKALLTIRKHRLWEVFLVEKLQYKWNEVHELAEQLEHVESNSLTDRLDAFLGYPSFDPHGDPIPDKQGRIRMNPSVPLSNCPKGKTYTVANLAETGDQFLNYLNKINIRLGTKIRLVEINEYDGSLTVTVTRKSLQLTEKAARNILVNREL
jgi:DtxR family Mn-dependent transcriptional regulator